MSTKTLIPQLLQLGYSQKMQIRTISVSYSRKFNLGNFNSVDLACSLWAQIAAEEDEDNCIQILHDKCRKHIRVEYYKAKNGSQPADLLRVNVASDNNDDNDSSIYEGIEPSELLDIGNK